LIFAKVSNDKILAIINATSPSKARILGKEAIPGFNVAAWDEERITIMKNTLRFKFTQWDDLRDQLLALGSRPLYESTGDRYWGIGASSSKTQEARHNPTLTPADLGLTGVGKLGQLLEELRGRYRVLPRGRFKKYTIDANGGRFRTVTVAMDVEEEGTDISSDDEGQRSTDEEEGEDEDVGSLAIEGMEGLYYDPNQVGSETDDTEEPRKDKGKGVNMTDHSDLNNILGLENDTNFDGYVPEDFDPNYDMPEDADDDLNQPESEYIKRGWAPPQL